MEITSIIGTVTQKDKKPYYHLHINCAKADGTVVGGHLVSAKISATCEMVITLINGIVERAYDTMTLLNLYKFCL